MIASTLQITYQVDNRNMTRSAHISPDTQDTTARAPTSRLLHFLALLDLRYIPNLPKLEIFIARTCANHVSSRTDGAPQDSCVVRVTNLAYAFHGWVGVYHNCVGRKAMGCQKFFAMG